MTKLWKKDVILAVALGALVFIVAAVTAPFAGEIAVATLVLSLLTLEVYRRLQIQMKEAALQHESSIRATFHQIEALMSVVRTIEPTFPLPSTRTWSASPDILNQLCTLLLRDRPAQVFEVGSGVSTLTMAYCLRRVGRGKIVSLENDPAFAAATRQMLADHGLSDRAQVIDAPLKEMMLDGEQYLWYDLSRIPETAPIDLLFVDGPHGLTQRLARYPALPVLFERLAPRGVVVLDDGARPDERAIAKRWSEEFQLRSEYLFMEKGAYLFPRDQPPSA
jgi:predicted O-methyltransferase YrrM